MMITLIFAGSVFGLLGGIAATCLVLITCDQRNCTQQSAPKTRPWKPSRQRRESLKRATRNARLMVMGGAIDIPQKRRRA